MEYDIHNGVLQKVALSIATASNGTRQGDILDIAGFQSVEFLPFSKLIPEGDYLFFIEQGDDSGLADAEMLPSELTLGSFPIYDTGDVHTATRVGSIGKKRFVRMSIKSENVSSSGGTFGALAVLSNPNTRPTPEL